MEIPLPSGSAIKITRPFRVESLKLIRFIVTPRGAWTNQFRPHLLVQFVARMLCSLLIVWTAVQRDRKIFHLENHRAGRVRVPLHDLA